MWVAQLKPHDEKQSHELFQSFVRAGWLASLPDDRSQVTCPLGSQSMAQNSMIGLTFNKVY